MRSKLTILLILLILLFTPGCWDLNDVNNTAFVVGIGVDLPTNSDTAKYKVTLEFAKPVPSQDHPTSLSTVVSTDADSILQAIQRIQSTISRRISLSHLRLIAIGEDIASKENFQDFTNYLRREPNLALRLRLVFVRNASARELFYTNPKFEKRITAEMVAMGMVHKELDIDRVTYFLDFINDLNRTKGSALGSRVSIQKAENIAVSDGASIYKDWKLVGWLNPYETQAANWLFDKSQAVVVAKEGKNTYTYEVSKHKTKIKPIIDSGKFSFIVRVTTEGMVMEEAGENLDLSKPENLKKMEVLFSDAIKDQIKTAINKSQKEIVNDYLGFENSFRRYHSSEFKSLDWNKVYPTIPIDVEVISMVKAYGLSQ